MFKQTPKIPFEVEEEKEKNKKKKINFLASRMAIIKTEC